jgi:CDP-diacylglycerol--serine O-phosphatidyltransferase
MTHHESDRESVNGGRTHVVRKRRRLVFSRFKIRNNTHLVPHLFTLGNAFFGFCSIILAAHGQFIAAAYLILFGALMDGLDGRVARYLGKTSDFGMQLDSLCDAISFCCAPAILVYFWQLNKLGFLGLLASACFIGAGLLRLARFNITHQQQSINFIGLPTTIAGCFLATLLLTTQPIILGPLGNIIFALLVISLAILMISKVPFPAFKKIGRNTYALASVIVAIGAIVIGMNKIGLALFMGYFLYSFARVIERTIFK